MKRAVLALVCLLLVAFVALPALAFAEEKATTTSATTTGLITYPEAKPDVSAAEAKAQTEWQKPGDGMNLAFALVGVGGIFGCIAWGLLASRRASLA